MPPRAPSSSSLPSLLSVLQSEFDAVLLELYDARKALDEEAVLLELQRLLAVPLLQQLLHEQRPDVYALALKAATTGGGSKRRKGSR